MKCEGSEVCIADVFIKTEIDRSFKNSEIQLLKLLPRRSSMQLKQGASSFEVTFRFLEEDPSVVEVTTVDSLFSRNRCDDLYLISHFIMPVLCIITIIYC
jgi:hypothetical protein